MIRIVSILVFVLSSSLAGATNYYVATTGNDTSGTGSSGNPWRNPQKCVQSGTPLVAGDTCVIRAGTYTNEDGSIPGGWKGRIMVITSASPVATSANPITIKADDGATVTFEIPNAWPGVDCNVSSCPFTGIYFSNNGSYYTVEGINFTRPGSNYYTNAAIAGITSLSATNGLTIRRNRFHDIARTVCHNGTLGNVGVYMQSPTNAIVEQNVFATIGRLRNGESGCSTVIFHHDHGVYVEASTNIFIHHNVFYDVTRGFPINLKARVSGTKTFHTKIYNNVFSGDSPTTEPAGQIALTNQLDDVQIKNNIFNDPEDGRFVWTVSSGVSLTAPVGAGIIIQSNLSNSTRTNATVVKDQALFSPITSSGNILSTSPGFTNVAGNDFTLASGSAAINACSDIGLSYNGASPDCGAFETFTGSGGTVVGNTLDAQLGMAFHTPLIPGTTGYTVNNGRSVTGVALVGSSIARLTFDGAACIGAQSWTWSYSGGTATDSFTVGSYSTFLRQPLLTVGATSVTNNCSGTSYSFTQSDFRYHGVFSATEAAPSIRSTENAATFNTVTNGAVRIRFSLVCDAGVDCASSAFSLYYAQGGGYSVLPNTPGGGTVSFCGATYTGDNTLTNPTPTTNQLSTAGTFRTGAVVFTSDSVPNVTLNATEKTEIEACVKFTSSATGSYTFRLYTQDGTALGTYTNTPSVTIIPMQANGGM